MTGNEKTKKKIIKIKTMYCQYIAILFYIFKCFQNDIKIFHYFIEERRNVILSFIIKIDIKHLNAISHLTYSK